MKRKKTDFIVIMFAVILLGITIIIALLAFQRGETSPPTEQQATPTPPLGTQILPPVFYDNEAELRLIEIIRDRPTLSTADQAARDDLIITILHGNNSGVVFETTNVRVEYVKEANVFQAEIISTDIQTAKDETNIWLRQQGLSQEGICRLPVMFYLDSLVAETLRGRNIIFSPLPNSC